MKKILNLNIAAVLFLTTVYAPLAMARVDVGDGKAAPAYKPVSTPDSVDRNYEAAVKNGSKTYTGQDGKTKNVTNQDKANVAARTVYRNTSQKHATQPMPTEVKEAIRQQHLASAVRAEQAKLQQARNEYKATVKANKKATNEELKSKAKEYAKNKKKYDTELKKAEKKLAAAKKKLSSNQRTGISSQEMDALDAYRKAITDEKYANIEIKRLEDKIEKAKKADGKELKKLFGIDGSKTIGINFDNNAAAQTSVVGALRTMLNDQKENAKKAAEIKEKNKMTSLMAETKLTANMQNDKAYKAWLDAQKAYDSNKEKREELRSNYLKLSKEERRSLSKAITEGTAKPAALKPAPKPGVRAGSGNPAASSTKAPSGKVDAASYAHSGKRPSNHAEGDIEIFTYIDTPGNNEKTDQRIGNIQLKVEKISGEADCDNRKGETVKTNATKFVKSKKTGKEKFVKGTANFNGCAPGEYKITFIGRDGYELRPGEDKVQTVKVSDEKTTEVVFTVVKSKK